MLTRRQTLLMTAGAMMAGPALANTPRVFAEGGLALRGFDPVAYFTQGAPFLGEATFSYDWNGATWRFAAEAHRAAFESNPERYAPAYGGYCAWAVSRNYTASTVPEAWHIHEDRLFLNYSLGVRRRWRRDVPGNVSRGDANWPGVLTL